MNSEEFRETFLRTTEKGPPRREGGKDGGKQRLGEKLEKRNIAAARCRGKRSHPGWISAIDWKGREHRS